MNVPSEPQTSSVPPRSGFLWLRAADVAITLLAVLLAGLTAAYVARNSDQWLHFAAGRDLLSGRYGLGTDPYSYLANDRGWVNHSWLYDVAAYGLYSLDTTGAAIVALKAALLALCFALVLGMRRRGSPAWAWWLLATVAILAAAPHTALRPLVLSALFVAMMLVVLFRIPWRPGSWRNPLILATICGLWANLDQWFLVGPLMIAATLAAETVQHIFLKQLDASAPRPADLAKALLLGLTATLANPHHIRVWEIPVELGFGLPAEIAEDPQLSSITLSPYANTFWTRPEYGGNVNGYAAGVLMLVGSGLLALGLSRTRLAYLFVWVVFLILALLHHRLILLLAIAAVPLVATPLSEIASRFADNNRLTLLLSSLARLLAVPVLLILLLCAWPGWLHPKPSDPAYAQRVGLAVEPDAGLARAARLVENWRTSGKLSPELHGTPLTVELANHIAWFAPSERVAVNGRFHHHRPELQRFLAARAAFANDRGQLAQALEALGARYVLCNEIGNGRLLNTARVFDLCFVDGLFLWHLDGRVAILGLQAVPALRFDPVALAFSPGQSPLPESTVALAPRRHRDPYADFFDPPKPVPLAAIDAVAWQRYSAELWRHRITQHWQNSFLTMATLAGPGVAAAWNYQSVVPRTPDDVVAANLLAQRSAWQAIADNPDPPQAYLALAGCAASDVPLPGFARPELDLQQATNLRRYLDRASLPSQSRTALDALSGQQAAEGLMRYYVENQMHGFSHEAKKLALEYQKQVLAFIATEAQSDRSTVDLPPERLKAEAERLQKELEGVNKDYAARLERFEAAASAPPAQRVQAALQLQLPGEALNVLKSVDLDKEFGPQARYYELLAVQIRLKAGLLEEAVPALTALQEKLKSPSTDAQTQAVNGEVARQLSGTVAEAQRLAGDYAEYGEYLDNFQAPRQSMPPDLKEFVRSVIGSMSEMQKRGSGAGYGTQPHAALLGSVGLGAALYQNQDATTIQSWLRIADYYRRRGLVALLEGRFDVARTFFEQSLAPEGIPLPTFVAERAVAERYLRMLNHAKESQ